MREAGRVLAGLHCRCRIRVRAQVVELVEAGHAQRCTVGEIRAGTNGRIGNDFVQIEPRRIAEPTATTAYRLEYDPLCAMPVHNRGYERPQVPLLPVTGRGR